VVLGLDFGWLLMCNLMNTAAWLWSLKITEGVKGDIDDMAIAIL
jgi:hypothetical protein